MYDSTLQRTVYDGHIFRWQRHGGILRYFVEVISRLPPSFSPLILGCDSTATNLPPNPLLQTRSLSKLRPRCFTQPILTETWLRRFLDSSSVFHPTYYQLSGGLHYSRVKSPIVITVHDFTAARFPHLVADAQRTLHLQRQAIESAASIICVSASTRADLVERFPQAESRAVVIHHGSSFSPPTGRMCAGLSDRDPCRLLFVGGRGTYKNFTTALRAFALARKTVPKLHLTVAGPPWSASEESEITSLGLGSSVRLIPAPDDETLRTLYATSSALIYPSLYEGFGIPALEAMATGCIPITANTSSLPEVVGNAGFLLDPEDINSWAEAMVVVARDDPSLRELRAAAPERVRRFDWKVSAERHVAIYKSLGGTE